MKTLLCLCFAVVLIFGCMFAFFSFHVLTRTDVEYALRGLVKIVNTSYTSSLAMHDRVTNASTSGAVSQLLSSITAPRLPASPLVAPTVTPTVVPTVTPTVAPTVVPAVAPAVVPAVVPAVAPTVAPTVASPVSAPASKVPVFIPHIAGFSAARDANVDKMLSTFSNAQVVVGVRGLDDECLQLLYDNNIRIANTFYRRDTVDVGKIGVTCAWIRVLLACKLSGSQRCVWIEDDIKLSVEEVATVERVALSKVFSTPLCQIGVDVSNSGMGDTIDIIRADKIDTIFTMLRKGIDDPSDLMFNKNKFYTRGEQIGGLINKNDPKTSVIRTQKSMPIVEYNAKISAMGTALQSVSRTSLRKLSTDMVVFIFSAREHRERRDAIRDSWSSGCDSCFFVIGDTHCHVPLPARKDYECTASREHTLEEKEAHDAAVQNIDNRLKVESDTFNDILFVEMVDAYRHLAEKLQLSYQWGVSNTNAKWFVKVDDDTFVRPAPLSSYLLAFTKQYTFIAHSFWRNSGVGRTGKWAELKYKPSKYPPFPGGAGHAVSRDIAEYVALHSLIHYQGEDTSMGIWMSEAPFTATLQSSAKFEGHNGNCFDKTKFVIGHDISPEKMRKCGGRRLKQEKTSTAIIDTTETKMTDARGKTFIVSPELDVANTIEIQKRILYMFKQFDEVCQRNNILYWAIGGTELGAHRHGGFIPWDADLDVCMHEDDYVRLKSVKNEFTEDIWFEDAKSDKYYSRKDLAKLRYLHSDYASYSATNKDCHNGIQIDIFIDLNNRNNRCTMYDKVRVQPVSRVKFEDAVINVVSDTVSALHVFFGADLESPLVGKRNQHQGTAIFYAPDWVKKKYPTLYPARDCYDDGKIKPECVQKSVDIHTDILQCPNGLDRSRAPPHKNWNLFVDVVTIFNSLDAPYTLHGGTLLNYARDCNVLDLDLDFTVTGTWMLTHHDTFLKTMEDNGFSIFRKFGNIGDFGYELAFKKGKSINVDVFTVEEEEDNFVSATWVRGFPYRCYTKRTSYEKRQWGGVTVRVPVPVDQALISHYGIHYDKPYPGTYQWDKTIFEFGWCKKKNQRLLRH